ncbi:MAG: vitamin B12 dependent-methionine synthase activation domain-containing protein [Alistipes sp.]
MRTRQIDIDYKDLAIDRQEIYRTMGYGDGTPNLRYSPCSTRCSPKRSESADPHSLPNMQRASADAAAYRDRRRELPPRQDHHRQSGGRGAVLPVRGYGRTRIRRVPPHLQESGDCVREFIADSVGSVLAEACVAKLEQQLDCDLEIPHTLPYSPGYCGWRVTEQHLLFGMLPDRPCGIELTESSLMYPIKSVSGIIGIGSRVERKPYGCTICRNTACYKRRIS